MSTPEIPPVPPAPQAAQPAPPAAQPAPPAPPVVPAEPAGPQQVETGNDRRDGLDKCPRCGSSEVSPIIGTAELQCGYCRFRWTAANFDASMGFDSAITDLTGTIVASGASDIQDAASTLITMKCQGCGAEVVIDTGRQLQARCHWCRQTLSQNTQIPNGAVPDAILPFGLTHAQAVERIKDFAGKRRLFAHKRFKQEFTPENVVGVYMPYLLVDGNLHADIAGVGEIQTRRYQRGSDNNKTTYYDADVYQVTRSFDFTVDDLTVESSSSRAHHDPSVNTNNVINTILPFDTKNAVRYQAHYMGEFTSEKRDLDIDEVMPTARHQMLSIARQTASDSAARFDRGVRWESEALEMKGTRWVSVLLPVWLYSYYEPRGNGSYFLHYIAVNGRTGETMGSVPVSIGRLLLAAFAIGTVVEGIAIAILVATA